jgi:hypothetical protein
MKKVFYVTGLIFLSVILTGCGQSPTTATAAAAAVVTPTSICSSGYVYSSTYGCLLQSNCPTGYGLYSGACVGLSSAATSSGCISITQTIPFSGVGLQIDSSNNIYGGVIPSYSTFGSMVVGTNSSVNGTTFTSIDSTVTGSFQVNVQSTTSSTYTSGAASVSGSLTIASYYQQYIESYMSSSGYGTSITPCVSGIAIQGHLYTTGSYGFGGSVYLYLNNTQHGVMLKFY